MTKPNQPQREAIFTPLFGENSGNDGCSFVRLRDQLIQATAAFAERPILDTGVDSLRARIRDALKGMKSELQNFSGTSVKQSKVEILEKFNNETVYPILTSTEVASVFGITASTGASYPYSVDATREKLVEDIAGTFFGLDNANCLLCHNGRGHLDTLNLWAAQTTRANIGGHLVVSILNRTTRHAPADDPVQLAKREGVRAFSGDQRGGHLVVRRVRRE